MGTEVLRPQDCLIGRIRVSSPPGIFSRRRNYQGSYNPNANTNYYCNYNNINNNYGSHHHNNSSVSGGRANRKVVVRHERPDQRRHQRAQSEPSVSRKSFYDEHSTRMVRRPSSDDLKVVRRSDNNNCGENRATVEKVTILRRGESLDSKIKAAETGRLAPADMYAGSGFAVSPAPSSLPLPSFSKKKQASIDDSATRDIKRLLRLEL